MQIHEPAESGSGRAGVPAAGFIRTQSLGQRFQIHLHDMAAAGDAFEVVASLFVRHHESAVFQIDANPADTVGFFHRQILAVIGDHAARTMTFSLLKRSSLMVTTAKALLERSPFSADAEAVLRAFPGCAPAATSAT